jgi:hypothetical protein
LNTSAAPVYKVGDVMSSGDKIEHIYGHSPIWLVFENEEGKVHWWTPKDDLSEVELEVLKNFDRLYTAIQTAVREGVQERLIDDIASALFYALMQADLTKALNHFAEIENVIKAEANGLLRLYYVSSSTLGAFIFLLLLLYVMTDTLDKNAKDILIGMCAACVGAWTSVLQRTSNMTAVQFDPPCYIAIQGVVRILIGAIFGGIFLVAAKAGLVLAVATTDVWAMICFSFIAGISERFVPELLGKIERGDEHKAKGVRQPRTKPAA